MGKENSLAPFPPPYVKEDQMYLHAIAVRLHGEISLEDLFKELLCVVEHERDQCAQVALEAQLGDEWEGRTAYAIEQAIRARSAPVKPKPEPEGVEDNEVAQI